jgi:MFS family permease
MQWLVLRFSENRSRVRLFGVVGIFWAFSWVLIGIAGVVPRSTALLVAFIGMFTFAIGETIWSPLLSGIVNDIAPEHIRGRYNASTGLTWVIAQAAGPAITGVLLGIELPIVWLGITIGGCLLAGALAQLMYLRLTPAEDGRA